MDLLRRFGRKQKIILRRESSFEEDKKMELRPRDRKSGRKGLPSAVRDSERSKLWWGYRKNPLNARFSKRKVRARRRNFQGKEGGSSGLRRMIEQAQT